MFGRVLKRRSFTPCQKIEKEYLKKKMRWTEASDFGVLLEKVVISLNQKMKKLEVQPSNQRVKLGVRYHGASPDGEETKLFLLCNKKSYFYLYYLKKIIKERIMFIF